jgi:hypothetical protein
VLSLAHDRRTTARAVAAAAPAYCPRRATETVLYAVVRDHLQTFLAHTRETYEPRYAELELRGYVAFYVVQRNTFDCGDGITE